jgi:histidine triad (HIT) family protein
MSETSCLFCRIVAGDIPAARVHEDDHLVVFLDTNPIRTGHALIVPREHHPYFDHLPPDLAARILQVGQRIARVQKERYGVQRVGFLFSGGDLPHVHAHLVPIHEPGDLTSQSYIAEAPLTFKAAPRRSIEELSATAQELRELLETSPSPAKLGEG